MSGSGSESSPIEIDSENDQTLGEVPKRPSKPTQTMHKNVLLDTPFEILHMIARSPLLSNVDRQSLKMTSKALRASGIQVINPTKAEFCLFNKQFEASLPHPSTNPLARKLLCHHCRKFLHKSLFPDAHAKAACARRPRTCLRCGIKCGELVNRPFLLGKQMQFLCTACKEFKLVETDIAKVERGTEFNIWQKFGAAREVELSVDVSRRRWCRECWKAISEFWAFVGEKGKMKERWTPGG